MTQKHVIVTRSKMEEINTQEKYIERNTKRYLRDLIDFIQIPSISTEDKGIDDAVTWLTAKMRALGIHNIQIHYTNRHPIITGALSPLRSDEESQALPRLLVYGHYDVQPPGDLSEWIHGPFEGMIQNGTVYGRGTCDMKNNLLASLLAIDVLRHQNRLDQVNLLFCFEGEEEIGSPSLFPFISSHQDLLACDAILVGEGGSTKTGKTAVIGGYKGFLSVEMLTKSGSEEIHSSYAGIVDNPAWRLVHALSLLKNQKGEVLIPGFYDGVKTPTFLEKAKYKLARLAMNRKQLENAFGIKLPSHLGVGKALSELFFRPTLNINGIQGGYPVLGGIKTIVPQEAHARLDARLTPGQDPNQIYEKLTQYLKKSDVQGIDIRKTAALPPYVAPATSPIIQHVAKAIDVVFESNTIKGPIAPASGAFTWLPTILKAPMASAGSGAVYMAHRPNEFIQISQFLKGIQLFTEIYSRYFSNPLNK